MANRQEFRRGVANEIGERAKNAIGEPICEWCLAVTRKRQLHHLEQDAMKRPEDKRKPLTARDGVLICHDCHQKVSAVQAVEFNKAERNRARFNGVEKPTAKPIVSRGFARAAREPKRLDPSKIANGAPAFARRFGLDDAP